MPNREIKAKEWFLAMALFGILIGGFGILCNSHSQVPDIQKISNWIMFLSGFLPVNLFGFLVWVASKRTGHKGVPIR